MMRLSRILKNAVAVFCFFIIASYFASCFKAATIHQIAYEGDVEKLKKSLSKGAYINEPLEPFYETPLIHAVAGGKYEAAKFLVENGANVNPVTLMGYSPLHIACNRGSFDMVKLLIDNKAKADAKNVLGETPLHKASRKKNTEVVSLLIDSGAQPNVDDAVGMAPLHLAANYSSSEIVELLIKAKADVNKTSNHGLTPLDIALIRNKGLIAEKLRENGGKANNFSENVSQGFIVKPGKYVGERGEFISAPAFSTKRGGFVEFSVKINWVSETSYGFSKRKLLTLNAEFFGEPGHEYYYNVDGRPSSYFDVKGYIYDKSNKDIVVGVFFYGL